MSLSVQQNAFCRWLCEILVYKTEWSPPWLQCSCTADFIYNIQAGFVTSDLMFDNWSICSRAKLECMFIT